MTTTEQERAQVPEAQSPRQTNPARERKFGATVKEHWKGAAAGATATLAIGAAAGALFFGGGEKAGSADREIPSGSDTTTSAPEVLGQEQAILAPEVVEMQTRFDAQLNASSVGINQVLTDHGWGDYNFFNRAIEQSSRDMTPQQILDRNLGKEYWVTANSDRLQALEDVALIAPQGTDPYSKIVSDINEGDDPTADPNFVISSRYFENGSYEGIVTATDVPTYLIGNTSGTTAANAIAIFQFEESADKTTGEWLIVKTITEGEHGWTDPTKLDQAQITQG